MDKCGIFSTIRQSTYLITRSYGTPFNKQLGVGCIVTGESQIPDSEFKKRIPITHLPRKPIQIPTRIERGPTDILKALASTIGRDYTAPNYKFHDDPFLIPTNAGAKRSAALAQESGRKAAKWIRQQNPQLYYHRNAEPPIMHFFPDPTIEDAGEVTEDTIKSLVNLSLLNEALKAYDVLRDAGKGISQDTRQCLLEAVAFYNEVEPIDEDWTEEIWHQAGQTVRDRLKNTWKPNGRAEEIFKEMESPDARAYCALICGRAKYYAADKAWELFEEALSKEIKLNTTTFNYIIRLVNFLKESPELRFSLLERLLTDMQKQGLQPNVGTLNAAFETLAFHGNTRTAKCATLELLAEFATLGVKPSLATYQLLLATFCKERGPKSYILVDILNELQGKTFEMQDPRDTLFFTTAMDLCRFHLQDLECANKVHELLLTGNNYDFIGDSIKESIYYRNYLIMKVNLEPLEQYFEFYDKIVPNVYTPEPAVMEEMLKAVELNEEIQYIPQLYSDMIIFDHIKRENLITLILQIMANHFPPIDNEQSIKLGEKLQEIGWKIWMFIETQDFERSNVVIWSGKMLGDLMTIMVKGGKFEYAAEVMKKLLAPSSRVVGVAAITALQQFLSESIKQNQAPMCLACIQYTSDSGYPEAADMAKKVFSQIKLDTVQVARLSNIVGFDLLATKENVAENVG